MTTTVLVRCPVCSLDVLRPFMEGQAGVTVAGALRLIAQEHQ